MSFAGFLLFFSLVDRFITLLRRSRIQTETDHSIMVALVFRVVIKWWVWLFITDYWWDDSGRCLLLMLNHREELFYTMIDLQVFLQSLMTDPWYKYSQLSPLIFYSSHSTPPSPQPSYSNKLQNSLLILIAGKVSYSNEDSSIPLKENNKIYAVRCWGLLMIV